MRNQNFDPEQKEYELRREADSWDTSAPIAAKFADIPVVDISDYLATKSDTSLRNVAQILGNACESVGFYQLVGHSIDKQMINETFDAVEKFHALPLKAKRAILMDRSDWPIKGVGYMPVGERKLPRRKKGNLNEAFLMKGSENIAFADNQWPDETIIPGFKKTVQSYAKAITSLALDLLPVYAVALGLEKNYFKEAFEKPFWRLRMTHYPAFDQGRGDDEFGIAPHVDTTFFTLLLQGSPGLTIYNPREDNWIRVPYIDGAYIVNSGELLKQWTNDRYLSTRHFANSDGKASRYSIPFFFNASADYPMECLPTCFSKDNPPKYPTISYEQSQAAAQGE
jgi:isopenicillin N synthase-like dioxygenase